MKVKGEGGREVSRRCPPRPEEEELVVVVVFAMLPSSEQRAVGRAAPSAPPGSGQLPTYLPVQVSRRAVALFSPLYCHSPSPLSAAAQVDKTRGRES